MKSFSIFALWIGLFFIFHCECPQSVYAGPTDVRMNVVGDYTQLFARNIFEWHNSFESVYRKVDLVSEIDGELIQVTYPEFLEVIKNLDTAADKRGKRVKLSIPDQADFEAKAQKDLQKQIESIQIARNWKRFGPSLLSAFHEIEYREGRLAHYLDSKNVNSLIQSYASGDLSDNMMDVIDAVKAEFRFDHLDPIFSEESAFDEDNKSIAMKYSLSDGRIHGACVRIFETLKTYPNLLRHSKGALTFHGSTSSSLLAFTEDVPTDKRGMIFPLGMLMKLDLVPFSGEIIFGIKGINRENISTTFFPGINSALSYAGVDTREKKFTYSGWDPESEKPENVKEGASFDLIRELVRSRQSRWLRLSPLGKELVQMGFPVLYGFRPHREDQYGIRVASDIPYEVAVHGPVSMEDIRVIFVPEEKVAFVRELVGDAVHVASIEETFFQ